MTIKVKTTTNYNNCNGQLLEVVEFLGTIVAAKIPQYGFNDKGEPQGDFITADFSLNEVQEIKN